MLCTPEYNESDEVVGVWPSVLPTSRCAGACCGGTVQLQIRTRIAYGRAFLCAAHFNAASGEYHTERTFTQETKLYSGGAPPGGTLVRTCTREEVYNSGPDAIWTTGDPEEDTDCGGSDPVITDPPDCYEGGGFDTSIPQIPTNVYGGDSATVADLLGEAIGALAWGEWSEWDTLGEISVGGGLGLDNLELYLAEATRGSSGTGYGAIATAGRYESELRVVGAFGVAVVVSTGVGELGGMALSTIILTPGTPHAFGVDPPGEAEDWQTQAIVLRCACPQRWAPTL